jgi:hypothetical protein
LSSPHGRAFRGRKFREVKRATAARDRNNLKTIQSDPVAPEGMAGVLRHFCRRANFLARGIGSRPQ